MIWIGSKQYVIYSQQQAYKLSQIHTIRNVYGFSCNTNIRMCVHVSLYGQFNSKYLLYRRMYRLAVRLLAVYLFDSPLVTINHSLCIYLMLPLYDRNVSRFIYLILALLGWICYEYTKPHYNTIAIIIIIV